MLLAASLFDAVVSSMETATRHAGGQRREPRVSLCTRMTILPCPDGIDAGMGAPLSVPVRDLSRGGLRFLLPRRLPLDTQFVTLLPRPPVWPQDVAVEGSDPSAFAAIPSGKSPDEPLAMLCSVTYWQPLAKELFAIGGHFVRLLDGVTLPNIPPRVVLEGEIEAEAAIVNRAAS